MSALRHTEIRPRRALTLVPVELSDEQWIDELLRTHPPSAATAEWRREQLADLRDHVRDKCWDWED